jgi:hypothetical protein
MAALVQCGDQSRLASTRRPDKSDATVHNVDGRSVERRHSTLMTQHTEGSTEQVGTNLAVIRGRCGVYHDLFAGSHKKAARRRKLK